MVFQRQKMLARVDKKHFEEFGSDAGFITPIRGWRSWLTVLIAEVIAV
jgi:hypothetical protein